MSKLFRTYTLSKNPQIVQIDQKLYLSKNVKFTRLIALVVLDSSCIKSLSINV